MFCFKDIHSVALVHLLLISKVHFDSLAHATVEHRTLLGKTMSEVPQVAQKAGLTDDSEILTDTGKNSGQEAFHPHIHTMGTPA